jgi:hypothetical protein
MTKRNVLGFVRKITTLNPVQEQTGQAQLTICIQMQNEMYCCLKIAPRKTAGTGSAKPASQ